MKKVTGNARPIDLKQARDAAENVRIIDEWQDNSNRLTVLCSRLHQTLDLNTMLDIFAEELNQVIPFAALAYRRSRSGGDFGYLLGSGGPHHCCYNLSLRGQELGSLRLDRRERFRDDELMVIEQAIGVLIQPLRNAWRYQEALESAMTDGLTGMGNRRALDETLDNHVEQARRYAQPLSLLLVDLDHFKQINDSLGHAAGDEILGLVSERIESQIRSCDQGFRYGGEEFAIVLPHTGREAAHLVAERLRQAFREQPMHYAERALSITASIGVATLDGNENVEELMQAADSALYAAKNSGRDRVRIAGNGTDGVDNAVSV
ncbi:MAG: GGDEF domain-containing protein [Halospina sp.]